MKTIQVEVADENVEYFLELIKDLRLQEPREQPKAIPAWQMDEVRKRLAEAEPEDFRPMEAYFEKHRGRGV